MHTKTYIYILGLILFVFLNFSGNPSLFGQEATIDLRFQTVVDCEQNELAATIQVKIRDETFKIGTSSLLFDYNESVVSFKSYESITFDENNKVDIFGTMTPIWSPHKFNGSVAGICNLTLLIDIAAASLPAIGTEWIDIGEVKFDILDLSGNPNLVFNVDETNFNKNDPNDGSAAPAKGDFLSFSEILNNQCACDAPTLGNDTISFNCFQQTFTADLAANDATSNPTFNLSLNPTKGTASINANGQLSYTSNEFFCGIDEFKYQVCNDGDTQCCSEAVIYVSFLDAVEPTFPNPPADITISCESLQAMTAIEATDGCSDIQLLQDESIVNGQCPNEKIVSRVWTATDGCGNQVSYTQIITVTDNIAPELVCLGDFSTPFTSDDVGTIDSGTPSYSDNCGDNAQVTLTFTDGNFVEVCQNNVKRQFTRVWTATDVCGNFSTCDQIIKLIDDSSPVITCPSDITVNCGADISANSTGSATAVDNSAVTVTVSFTDVGEMPSDCTFDSQVISRTWRAEDECGNTSECVQEIAIQGTPCPTTIIREITSFQCDGQTVDLIALMGFAPNDNVSILGENNQAVSNPSEFLMPTIGCVSQVYEFTFQTFNDSQCLVENSKLIINSIPQLFMSSSVSEDKCTVELILECQDLYDVTWTDGTNNGTGRTYVATPGESGNVVFTINNNNTNFPDSLNLGCLAGTFEVAFNCDAVCPPSTQQTIQLALCEGDIINFEDVVDITSSDSLVSSSNGINLTEYVLVTTDTSCGSDRKDFSFTVYNQDACPTRNVNVEIVIIKKTQAEIVHEDDLCKVRLDLACPDSYNVTWKDNNGNTGSGLIYQGSNGMSGAVTFYTSLMDIDLLNSGCPVDSFIADYICSAVCPETTERTEILQVCAQTDVNLVDKLSLTTNITYIIEQDTASLLAYPIGNLFGCDTGVKNLQIKGYDATDCLLEIINVELKVFPAIYGDIQDPTQTTCGVVLNLECPENYTVTWQDTDGNSGDGTAYSANANTTGLVTFMVTYLTDEVISSDNDLSCLSRFFEANYNCPSNCPETTERTESLQVCAQTTINIVDRLDLASDIIYMIDQDTASVLAYQLGNSFGCNFGVTTLQLKGYDANQCLVEIINLELNVFPAVYGDVQVTADVACGVALILECPENYTVTWQDADGNSGEGSSYNAIENTSGVVTFTVVYSNDTLDLTGVDSSCITHTFEGNYNCHSNCPEVSERAVSITVCAETTLNIMDRLALSTDLIYTIEQDIDSIMAYPVGNLFGCETGVKSLQIKGYDANQCLVEIINLELNVFPAIYGEVNVTADVACGVVLTLECSENYTVTWQDTDGNSGVGTGYTAVENTSGAVTYTVVYSNDTMDLSGVDSVCITQIFESNYSCISNCPEVTERVASLPVCAETTLNIKDRLALSNDLQYVIEQDVDSIMAYPIGNLFGCEIGVKSLQIKGYDANQCLVEIINLELKVYPSIYGNIDVTADEACGVVLNLECPENYTVSWQDTDGNSGAGALYTPAENTSGVVSFTVDYLTDEIILSEVELVCFNQVFEANYNCNTDCPTPTQETAVIAGCHGGVINLKEQLGFSNNLSYTILNNENNQNIEQFILENNTTDCSIDTVGIVVEARDSNNCLIHSATIFIQIVPAINASIVLDSIDCSVALELECPEKYDVFWSDNLGNNGQGMTYQGASGTSGNVEFEISYKDINLLDGEVDSICHSLKLVGDFECCNAAGTACDDGNSNTHDDQEDGECGCVGTPCDLASAGVVYDGSEITGCNLLIELSDGTILEPAILPSGVTLSAGQELIFSYVELTDMVSVCQSGIIVEIICLENVCPEQGTPCNDGDLSTINDAQDGNCNCLGESIPEIASEIDLRLRPTLDCTNNAYCVMIQAKAQQTDLTIGTSSLMISYNKDALEFVNYTSEQFDEQETCIGGSSSPWSQHQYDATSVPGKMCLTMVLDAAGASCPEITTENWEDVGQICFDIMDNSAMPNIHFDTTNTHFNSSSPNDGTAPIRIGTLHEIDMESALECNSVDTPLMNGIAVKAYLQGPLMSNNDRMDDVLRKKGFIPLKEPYTGLQNFVHFGEGGGETTTSEVLQVNGSDGIVDWVFLELRAASDASMVVATKSGLIQRDGDIVDTDGVSNIQFLVQDGSYYLAVKHRNHLGVMTALPIDLSSDGLAVVDFTNPNTSTYGEHAQTQMNDVMALWGGNATPDSHLILAGGGLGLPDRDMIFFDIFLSLWYANPDSPITYNSVLQGYYGSDTNMDGKVKYQGPNNDIDAIIFFNVLFHPENTQYRLNYIISEQIPE